MIKHFFSNTTYGYNPQSMGCPADITYGVVNEREVRGVAGLMFAIGLITLCTTVYTRDTRLLSLVLPIFFLEFFLKVLRGPHMSVFIPIIRPLISRQKPEYVGAIQKRFAWTLGMVFAGMVGVIVFILGIRGMLPILLCSTCLLLMWLESVLGICVGCNIYTYLVDHGYIERPEIMPTCPGGVCEIPNRQHI